jgi:NADPH-dependent 2,4-dienoyl-CoA reductase/sulfur reductase-like enzyme
VSTRPLVVVGAGAAGLTVVEGLRREGFDGSIVLLGDEAHPPYDRPPLSKGVLGGSVVPERLALRDAAVLAALDVDFRLGRPAVGLDLTRRRVVLERGDALDFGTLVIATGVSPVLPRGVTGHGEVQLLRTIDDAHAIAASWSRAGTVAVVGGGLLGYELAATARGLGLEVDLIDRARAPLARRLGPEVGAITAALHRERGVRLRTGASVVAFEGVADGVLLTLDGAERVTADHVVAAVGSRPNTGWLAGSGLRLADGVVCDAVGRAAADVYAIGDVAWWPRVGRREHRTNATDQALVAARHIVHGVAESLPHPYFWSDQFETRIQVSGHVDERSRIEVIEGSVAQGRFVALASNGGDPAGVIGWRMPREFAARRLRAAEYLAS